MSFTLEEKFNGIFSAIIISTVIALGIGGLYNYFNYDGRVVYNGEVTKKTEMYGVISRLETKHEKGSVTEISQISVLGNSKRFELDEKRLVKNITETGINFFSKPKTKTSSIEMYSQKDRERINEDVENYFKYLKKEEQSP